MSPFRAWARKFPTWFRWGSSSDASGSRGGHHHHHHHHHHHRPQQDQDQGQDQGGDGGGSDASGAHGWGGGARGGFGRGWGGAGWGKGLYGGAWQGAYVPVYNPALLDPEAWSAYGETEGYDVPQDPSQGAPDASGNAGYGDLWPYSEPTTVLAGNPFSRPAPSRPGEHGGFWDYGYGGQMGGLWPYESAAQPLTGSSPFSHGPASTGAYAGPGIRGGAIRGVVTERDLVDAIARIEHYAAVINHDINANPPALPGAADAWRAYVKGLLVRLQGMRQADKTIFSAGALADLLVTEAAGLNAARAILVAQGAALTNMPALVLPFAGAQASSGVWHWATFGLTLGGLVVLDKITRAIRARYARQGLAAKIASAKAPPGAVSGLWSWPTMMWTLGGTTLLDLATKDRAWARSHLLPHLNATGGPSSLIIAASTPLPPAPPAPPPPPPPAAGNYRGYRASYPRRHPY
jgi:hypothetical protein